MPSTIEVVTAREQVVHAHLEAVSGAHDVSEVLATFFHSRYEVPALGSVADGPEAAGGLLTAIFSAFPDFFMRAEALYHADDAVIAEVLFGGTQAGKWAGIESTGKHAEVKGALIFVFNGVHLVCEKVYFDHGTILRQLTSK